ncbi:hypothetical protein [Afifella pfennigii]|uniref:hypothetical protein n=1 Tax=Afifella pfennigii TaxID=209897 RepID=UPI0004786A67|nr:hypothetical protein [Afifella pfennigii]
MPPRPCRFAFLLLLPFLTLLTGERAAANACATWSAEMTLFAVDGRGMVASVCGTEHVTPAELRLECRGADALNIRYAPGHDGEEPADFAAAGIKEEVFLFSTDKGSHRLRMRWDGQAGVFWAIVPARDRLIEDLKAGMRLSLALLFGRTQPSVLSLVGSRRAIERVEAACLKGRVLAP